MPSRDSIAKKVRSAKKAHPEQYCRYPGCLYRIQGFCPRHKDTLYALNYPATYQDCEVNHA